MKGDYALLHRCKNEIADCQSTILHRPEKLKGHVDGLSQLPMLPMVATVSKQEGVNEELATIVRQIPTGPCNQGTVVEGRAYDGKDRLIFGPLGAAHAMKILHNSATGHLGVIKLLTVIRERYTDEREQQLDEQKVSSCHGC